MKTSLYDPVKNLLAYKDIEVELSRHTKQKISTYVAECYPDSYQYVSDLINYLQQYNSEEYELEHSYDPEVKSIYIKKVVLESDEEFEKSKERLREQLTQYNKNIQEKRRDLLKEVQLEEKNNENGRIL